MTSVRPEHEYDPLTDPLPPGAHGSPWFRSDNLAPDASAPVQEPVSPAGPEPAPGPLTQAQQWYEPGPAHHQQDWRPRAPGRAAPLPVAEPEIPISAPIFLDPPAGDETVALPSAAELPAPARHRRTGRAPQGRQGPGTPRPRPPAPAPADGPAPARRRAGRRKARKDSAAVIASRVIGEAFITLGVVMLLFVTYQLWWTNVRAHQEAGSAAKKIAQDWADGRKPGTFAPGQGFAIMHIPKLDIVAPIAQGTSKAKVLDKGMIGHYDEDGLKTAMPRIRPATSRSPAHRNTHGEPFRYINRLKPGDKVVVETQDAYYTYEITSRCRRPRRRTCPCSSRSPPDPDSPGPAAI